METTKVKKVSIFLAYVKKKLYLCTHFCENYENYANYVNVS